MWFKCTISTYYFKKICILSKNALFIPIFCIIFGTVLKIISNHYFHPLFHSCHQVQFKKNLTYQNKKDTPAWKTCNIILNDKTTEKKNRFVSKSSWKTLVPCYWITKTQKRRKYLFEKLGNILLNGKTTWNENILLSEEPSFSE